MKYTRVKKVQKLSSFLFNFFNFSTERYYSASLSVLTCSISKPPSRICFVVNILLSIPDVHCGHYPQMHSSYSLKKIYHRRAVGRACKPYICFSENNYRPLIVAVFSVHAIPHFGLWYQCYLLRRSYLERMPSSAYSIIGLPMNLVTAILEMCVTLR